MISFYLGRAQSTANQWRRRRAETRRCNGVCCTLLLRCRCNETGAIIMDEDTDPDVVSSRISDSYPRRDHDRTLHEPASCSRFFELCPTDRISSHLPGPG